MASAVTTVSHEMISATTAMDEELSPDILLTGMKAVFARLANLDNGQDILVVGNVSPSSFRALEAERDRKGQHYRLLYQPATERVMITVPTIQHSEMHMLLYDMTRDTMVTMGALHEWRPIRTTAFRAADSPSG